MNLIFLFILNVFNNHHLKPIVSIEHLVFPDALVWDKSEEEDKDDSVNHKVASYYGAPEGPG